MDPQYTHPPWDHFPTLDRKHLADARLYADRWHMIENLGPKKLGAVVEVGVALGDFSKALINRYEPEFFYAIDLFTLHQYPSLWDRDSAEIFEGKTHSEVYLDRMQPFRHRISIRQGDGADELAKLPDASIDLIYIDGSHSYENVVRDGAAAIAKIKPGGLIIFNDYIIWSHLEKMWYGVIPVVNDIVVNKGGKVVAFALHPQMYTDIAIQM